MEIEELPIDKIRVSVFQPRETFEKGELQELADSMKEHGLINPISVKENGDGTYQIIAGERRWRAAKFARMNKIYAIVREVTDEQQRLESLIENVHRKDLNTIEKGRGMMEIFKINEIDMKPRELSKALSLLRIRKKIIPETGTEKKILEAISKIHVKPRLIELWLDSISADEEVIKDHLQTPEKERVADDVIARVATIKDKDLQKKTYAKIKRQDLSQRKASEFVTGIKRLAEKKPKLTKMALESDLPIDFIEEMPEEEEPEVEIPQEEIDEITRKLDEGKKRTAEILAKPIVKERKAHFDNEANLSLISSISKEIFCPYCGKDGSHLRFICHSDKTLQNVAELAHTNFIDATKRKEIDNRFAEIIKRVREDGLQTP